MIVIGEPVRSVLIARINEACSTQAEIVRIEKQYSTTVLAHTKTWASFGWRERYLGGAFGGDKQLVARYRELDRLLTAQSAQLRKQVDAHMALEKDIFERLDAELQRDSTYLSLRAIYADGDGALDASHRLIRLLEAALREVKEAQDVNMLDAVGVDNMAAFDYLATQEARDAVEAVNRYLPEYRKALRRFLNAEGTDQTIHNLDEFLAMLDITDLALEFGLGDFLQIEELENCRDVLQSHLNKARRTADQALKILVSLDQQRKAMHNEVREALVS